MKPHNIKCDFGQSKVFFSNLLGSVILLLTFWSLCVGSVPRQLSSSLFAVHNGHPQSAHWTWNLFPETSAWHLLSYRARIKSVYPKWSFIIYYIISQVCSRMHLFSVFSFRHLVVKGTFASLKAWITIHTRFNFVLQVSEWNRVFIGKE